MLLVTGMAMGKELATEMDVVAQMEAGSRVEVGKGVGLGMVMGRELVMGWDFVMRIGRVIELGSVMAMRLRQGELRVSMGRGMAMQVRIVEQRETVRDLCAWNAMRMRMRTGLGRGLLMA